MTLDLPLEEDFLSYVLSCESRGVGIAVSAMLRANAAATLGRSQYNSFRCLMNNLALSDLAPPLPLALRCLGLETGVKCVVSVKRLPIAHSISR
jgi:hypothetical protein